MAFQILIRPLIEETDVLIWHACCNAKEHQGSYTSVLIRISWNSNTLAIWCEELTHLKRPWCWERSKVGGEGDDRGWDGWMASPTQWTWVWVNSGSWWWTGRPSVLQSMRSQRVGHDWVNWTDWIRIIKHPQYLFPNCAIMSWQGKIQCCYSIP